MDIRSIEKESKIAENAVEFGAAAAVSRVLGYVRDAGIVYIFGAGAVSDAYYAAFRISNFFRRTIGEGTLNAAFVPLLAGETAKSPEQGRAYFGTVWTAALLATAVFTLLGIILAVPLVWSLTYGFTRDAALFGLTVSLTRIMFWQVLFVVLSALCQGALYMSFRFFLPALAPVTFSLSIIAYLAVLLVFPESFTLQARIKGLAAVSVFGSGLQLALLIPALRKSGYTFRLMNPFTPGMKLTAVMLLPALVCSAGDQISMFADMIFASFLAPGSITAIYNSVRIMQLPLALFGVAAANSALAHMSAAIAAGDRENFRSTYSLAVRLAGFVLVPASAGIMLLNLPIVRALFEHGKFSGEQSFLTAHALFFLSFGLLAHGINKISVMAFYSLKNWKTPLKIISLQIGAEIALCAGLMGKMGVAGLTLASSLAACVGTACLLSELRKQFGPLGCREILVSYLKFFILSVVMAAACAVCLRQLAGFNSAITTAVTVLAGTAVYGFLAVMFKLKECEPILFKLGRARRNPDTQ